MYKLIILLITLLLTNRAVAAEVSFGGYYKNILINSKTISMFSPSESYLLDLNRLRLKLKGNLNDRISFKLQYDNEILIGNYLETDEFTAVIKNQKSSTYINLENNYVNNTEFFGKQRLYRGYVDFSLSNIDFRIGRQRIAWGTAMMWNPMDILNVFNPVQLERQERVGIDAALLDWDYSALSRVSLVYAKQQSGDSSAVRWHGNQKGFDFSLMAGKFRDDNVIGFDFAGQLTDIGIRGEITQTNNAKNPNFIRGVFGVDYTFENSFSVNVEMYYNGLGSRNIAAYNFNQLLTAEIQSLARRYVGLYFGFDYTPILKWSNYLIVNVDDNSIFFAPGFLYTLTDNAELSTGLQIFDGDPGSEYGSLENRYYLQFQTFF